MYVSRSCYKTRSANTNWYDWGDATVYNTTFIPQIGDYVFFDWSTTSDYVDHVGIVTSVSKTGYNVTITTIEGNTNGNGSGSAYYSSSVVGSHSYTFNLADESKLYSANGSLRGYITGFGRID